MDELIKSIHDLIKEIRALTIVVGSLLPSEDIIDDDDDEPAPKTYLDGTPI